MSALLEVQSKRHQLGLIVGYPNSPSREQRHEVEGLSNERAIKSSLNTIISSQNPDTGLLPAASTVAFDKNAHMDDFWLRDHMEAVRALSNGVRKVYGKETDIGHAVDEFSVRAVEGVFNLWKSEPWQVGFSQEVKVATDGHTYLENPDLAPPIHAKTSGDACSWYTQNQPDAYGVSLTAVAQVLNNGSMIIDQEKKELLEQVVGYLLKTEPHHFESASMWEMEKELHSPSPLSTVAAVSKGLNDIQRFVRPNLKRRIGNALVETKKMVRANFPVDFTSRNGHLSSTDLATLYVMSTGGMDEESVIRYLNKAKTEIFSDDAPGSIRYKGDPYHITDEREAVWPMALALAASTFFSEARKRIQVGHLQSARTLIAMANNKLENVKDISASYGFMPELFENREGKYLLPNGVRGEASDLLWGHATVAQASALAILTERELSLRA